MIGVECPPTTGLQHSSPSLHIPNVPVSEREHFTSALVSSLFLFLIQILNTNDFLESKTYIHTYENDRTLHSRKYLVPET